MRGPRFLATLAPALALCAFAQLASADVQGEAVALFDQGIKDFKAGNYDKACKELAASNDKWPDSGTKGALALCFTQQGKLASAWQLWHELADIAPKPELRANAAKKADALAARVPHYTIKLAQPTPGIVVSVNGSTVDASLNLPLPIDPGPVSVTASAEGYATWTGTSLVAVEGQTLDIAIPALTKSAEPAGGTSKTGGGPMTKPGGGATPDPIAIDLAATRHRRHVVALAVGGVGVAAGVVGGVFGLQARSHWNEAKQTCGGSIDACSMAQLPRAQKQVDDARHAGTLSTIGFGVAGAAIATGVIVWLTAPHDGRKTETPTISPTVGAGTVGVSISGSL